MQVIKRSGRKEPVKLDKITSRIAALCELVPRLNIDPVPVAIKTVTELHDGITTAELDIISAKIANDFSLDHPDYGVLAGRICVSNLHKTTPASFSDATIEAAVRLGNIARRYYHWIRRNAAALDAAIDHAADYSFDYFGFATLSGGYLLRYHTPEGTAVIIDRPQYMWMRVAVAIHADTSRLELATAEELGRVIETYSALSRHLFTHATPTLYNSLGRVQQLNSCFLLSTADSIEEIQRTITNTSLISKWAGGIGVAFHNIRAAGSRIRGTGGASSGLPKQLKIYNDSARTWDQGGKRKGAYAAYLEPWHADIVEFLQLKKNQGADEVRARDLFYALWVPDLFVARVEADAQWSLFSEDTAPGLGDVFDGMRVCTQCGYCENRNYFVLCRRGVIATTRSKFVHGAVRIEVDYYGDEATAADDREGGKHSQFREVNNGWPIEALYEDWVRANVQCGAGGEHAWEMRPVFTELYTRYEREGRAIRVVKARDILALINELKRETGTPYICFKDHANRRTNQANVGTIRSSNLCAEIMQWHSEYSYACCCLASINLRAYVRFNPDDGTTATFDHAALHAAVKIVARNLDGVIDVNSYPVKECVDNAVDLRPIGIGVQGLADTFAMLRLPYLSPEAAALDVEIAETIYHAALETSCELARERGAYAGFAGSPAARGILQFDMWSTDIDTRGVGDKIWGTTGVDSRSRHPAATTRDKIVSGRYDWNALKSRIRADGLRNSLSVALMPTASTSQVFGNTESFEPFAGYISTKSTLFGKFIVTNQHMIRHLIELDLWTPQLRDHLMSGSLLDAPGIPAEVAAIYKTVWELPQRELMRRSALRGAFIDQSQSLNVYVTNNSDSVLRAIFLAGHEFGLKTGTYYTRSRPAAAPMRNNLARSLDSAQLPVRGASKKSAPSADSCAIGCDSCGA